MQSNEADPATAPDTESPPPAAAGGPSSGGGRTRPPRKRPPRRRPAGRPEPAADEPEALEADAESEEGGPGMPPLASQAPTTGSLAYLEDEDAYVFAASPVSYRVRVGPEAGSTGRLIIEGRRGDDGWRPLLTTAVMRYRAPEDEAPADGTPGRELDVLEFRHAFRGRILTLRTAERHGEQVLRRSTVLRLVGNSLSIAVRSAPSHGRLYAAGFALGEIGGPGCETLHIPGALDPLRILPGPLFLSAYVDRYCTAATFAPGEGTEYLPDSAGKVQSVSDLFYLTLSEEPLDCLPALPIDAPGEQADLLDRVVMDLYSERPYAEDRRRLGVLGGYGCRRIALLYRNWQRFGYRRRSPCLYPADAERGTNEEFRDLVAAARRQGWLVGLREEYASIEEDSPYWDPALAARSPGGAPWESPLGGKALAADRMLSIARLEASEIQRNYEPNAAWVDAQAGWSPADGLKQVDLGRANGRSRNLAAAAAATRRLLQYLRDLHQGPLLATGGMGPGRFDTMWAGLVNASERPLEEGARAPLIVDYELRVVRAALPGFGVGVYARFVGEDRPVDPDTFDWDLYRATEIAFGRMGYISTYSLGLDPAVDGAPMGSVRRLVAEYHLMHALQAAAGTSPVDAVEYRVNGEMLPLRLALARGHDLSGAQVWRRHENGLEVWVNRDPRATWTVRAATGSYDLPPTGWLAVNPETGFRAYSARIAGNRVDACVAPEYTFLDTRADVARRIEGVTCDGVAVVAASELEGEHDFIVVGCRTLTAPGVTCRLSERADVALRRWSDRLWELRVMDSNSGKPIQVSLPGARLPDGCESAQISEVESQETQVTAPTVEAAPQGIVFGRVRPGSAYRIRFR